MSQEYIFVVMAKTIYLEEGLKKKLLDVFENIKDEYVPDSPDWVLVLLDIKDAIENGVLTSEHLIKLKGCEKYEQIMNILRTARINFDLTKYVD